MSWEKPKEQTTNDKTLSYAKKIDFENAIKLNLLEKYIQFSHELEQTVCFVIGFPD